MPVRKKISVKRMEDKAVIIKENERDEEERNKTDHLSDWFSLPGTTGANRNIVLSALCVCMHLTSFHGCADSTSDAQNTKKKRKKKGRPELICI
jgi:hypothetical protein